MLLDGQLMLVLDWPALILGSHAWHLVHVPQVSPEVDSWLSSCLDQGLDLSVGTSSVSAAFLDSCQGADDNGDDDKQSHHQG